MRKKIILSLIINFVLFLCTGVIALKLNQSLVQTGFKYASITFAGLIFITLLIVLYKKLLKEDNSKFLLIFITIVYLVFSSIYEFTTYNNLTVGVFKNVIIALFYVSIITFVFIYSTVFYFWISQKKIKYIIRLLVILLLLLGLCLIFILISNHLNVSYVLMIILNFIYVSSILLLFSFMVIYIIHKLVLPGDKK